ncbi:MAG: 4-phosphoerythronate dehydrogenase PdxB [Bacteroidales bacterium]|nr:4-phosphoerythronate dehydrogenase PdxB [Bacteroidales bacterium]
MLVIADEKIPYLKGALEPFTDIEYYPGDQITPERIEHADALLIRTRTKCNRHLLEGSSVKFVATATIGFDHIDTDYCNEQGIYWTNAPGCNASSVNQYIASVLVTLSRQQGFKLKDRVLGVVGVGNVGSKVVKTAELLHMRVYLNDPPRVRKEGVCGFLSLDSIIRECDIITFHVPLSFEGIDKTFHMIDEPLLSKLNKGTIIINSSRGEVADTEALKRAQSSGRIGSMVFDVWEGEPDIDRELLPMTSVATPHIAGYSADGKANGTAMAVQALSRFFNLDLEDWEPENIPLPEKTTIMIDCKHMDVEDILGEAILFTYQVELDDKRLRASVETFEKQRGNYPLRREFPAFTVRLMNEHSGVRQLLMKMGFRVEQE